MRKTSVKADRTVILLDGERRRSRENLVDVTDVDKLNRVSGTTRPSINTLPANSGNDMATYPGETTGIAKVKLPSVVGMLFPRANCELKTWLISSIENVSGSVEGSEEVQVIVLVLLPLRLGWAIVIVACAKDTRARTAALRRKE